MFLSPTAVYYYKVSWCNPKIELYILYSPLFLAKDKTSIFVIK